MNGQIPEKLTFKRNEVIKISRLDGKVLDYWETELGGFAPMVNPQGEKFYSRNDLESILKIKKWISVDKIPKTKIKDMIAQKHEYTSNAEPTPKQIPGEKLKIIRRTLQEILTILDKNDKF